MAKEIKDKDLAEFEAARADRTKRTDFAGDPTARDRHEGTAAELARAYVDKHPELEAKYGQFGIPRLVQLIDAARDREDVETVAEIDAWLMAKHPPQVIGASVNFGGGVQ